MSLNEAKEKLHVLIEQVDDAKVLKAYSDLIQKEIEKSKKKSPDFEKLPAEIKTALKKSLAESKKNKTTDAITFLNSLKKK